MPRTRAYQHQVLPTSFCLFIFSRSSFSLVRYCLYSLNSFRVQTTYRETRADDSQELLWQLPTQPSRNVQAPSSRGAAPLHPSLPSRGDAASSLLPRAKGTPHWGARPLPGCLETPAEETCAGQASSKPTLPSSVTRPLFFRFCRLSLRLW